MKPKILFLHIPKTGGTSVSHYLKKLAHQNKIEFLYKGHAKPQLEDTVNNYSFTILRGPVSHCASMFAYHKYVAPSTTWVNQFASKRNFYEWVRDFDQMNNYYCNYFGSGSFEDSQKMLLEIDFILYQESLIADMNKMMRSLGIEEQFNSHINKTSNKPSIDDKTSQLIQKKRSLDYKLLNWTKTL